MLRGSTSRRAEGSLKSWHPPPLSATPVAPTPTSILAAFPRHRFLLPYVVADLQVGSVSDAFAWPASSSS